MAAAGKGRLDDVITLLANGADASAQSRDGSTAANWASRLGNALLLDIMLDISHCWPWHSHVAVLAAAAEPASQAHDLHASYLHWSMSCTQPPVGGMCCHSWVHAEVAAPRQLRATPIGVNTQGD